MMHKSIRPLFLALGTTLALSVSLPAAAEVDEEAAKLLFKQNECGKCHNPEKTKKGPSLKKIAKERAGKADAEKKLVEHMTKGAKVKLEDGTEEDHKIVDTKDPKALKNLAQWILSH